MNIYEPVSQADSPTIYTAFWSSIRRLPTLHAILHKIFQSKIDRDTQMFRLLNRVGSGVRRKKHEQKLSNMSIKTMHRIEQNLVEELAPPQMEQKLNVAHLRQVPRSISTLHKYTNVGSGSKLQNRVQRIFSEDLNKEPDGSVKLWNQQTLTYPAVLRCSFRVWFVGSVHELKNGRQLWFSGSVTFYIDEKFRV